MLVLSSPSGAGKTSIARALLTRDGEITMSVSATTRPRRPGETEGKDYFFVNEQKFKTDINKSCLEPIFQVLDHSLVDAAYQTMLFIALDGKLLERSLLQHRNPGARTDPLFAVWARRLG